MFEPGNEQAKATMLFHLYQSNIAALLDLYKEEKANKEIVDFIERSLLITGHEIMLNMGLDRKEKNPAEAKGDDSLI